MRWLCRDCHHPTSGSWCNRCRRDVGVFTSADLGPPTESRLAEGVSKAEADWVVGKVVVAYGGSDPKGGAG